MKHGYRECRLPTDSGLLHFRCKVPSPKLVKLLKSLFNLTSQHL
jgi:hypothetical protein